MPMGIGYGRKVPSTQAIKKSTNSGGFGSFIGYKGMKKKPQGKTVKK